VLTVSFHGAVIILVMISMINPHLWLL